MRKPEPGEAVVEFFDHVCSQASGFGLGIGIAS
jgi:hypothetical protein